MSCTRESESSTIKPTSIFEEAIATFSLGSLGKPPTKNGDTTLIDFWLPPERPSPTSSSSITSRPRVCRLQKTTYKYKTLISQTLAHKSVNIFKYKSDVDSNHSKTYQVIKFQKCNWAYWMPLPIIVRVRGYHSSCSTATVESVVDLTFWEVHRYEVNVTIAVCIK